MITIARILTWFVAIEHVLILVLEMFLWETDFVRKAFMTTPEFASASKVLAMNQGLYNGFLAAGLFWALLFISDKQQKRNTILFFLGCIVVAGIFGGLTAKFSIIFSQGTPAFLGFLANYFSKENKDS